MIHFWIKIHVTQKYSIWAINDFITVDKQNIQPKTVLYR